MLLVVEELQGRRAQVVHKVPQAHEAQVVHREV